MIPLAKCGLCQFRAIRDLPSAASRQALRLPLGSNIRPEEGRKCILVVMGAAHGGHAGAPRDR